MRLKRTSQRTDKEELTQKKRHKIIDIDDYFKTILLECGLEINNSPEKCVASYETIVIIRNLKNNLKKHADYPCNLSEFYSNFQERCQELTEFKHYLFPNIVRKASENSECSPICDSLVKILLCVPFLQDKLIDFIFEKATDLAAESNCGPWIQMILKCFSSLDSIVDSNKISVNLIELLEVTSENIVRLEIITAIPDIIGDQAHDNIAAEMSRILSEDHDMIPAILDCLSYLCLSDEQYEQLQKKTLNILMTLPKCNNFSNFVKFLLMPGRSSDNAYLQVVQGLRNALCWSTSFDKPEEIVSSQILTATAIRNSIVSSKVIANAWLKTISVCTLNTDHRPIDVVTIVILYSTSEEKQKQIENIVRKQIKNNILNEELLDEAFEKFKPIIKEYLKHLLSLTNSLLKIKSEPAIQCFATHMYTLMFSTLEEYCQTIVAELLQLGLDSKQCVMNILSILNKVASKDMSILKPQSIQMMSLLDRMDDMILPEIRAVMNLVCGLAYSYENSVIRDDIHMIIRKELGSSNPTIKVQGILSGIHAVKYLMRSKDGEDQSIDLAKDISYSSVNHLIEGDIREAAQIIELISHNTRQFPDMIAFFYDEFCKIILSSSYINKHFLHWIIDAVTNDLEQNFIVSTVEENSIHGVKLGTKYCLNTDSEIDGTIAVDVGNITMNPKEDINILILSPLLLLLQTLQRRKYGDLSMIDALLGCPVMMPIFEIDMIDEMNTDIVSLILDCQIHCCNWFRELVNAFATQDDPVLKTKVFNRISHIFKLENFISQMLLNINFNYNQPTQISLKVNPCNHFGKHSNKNQNVKTRNPKKAPVELLPDTCKSQSTTRNNNIAIKNRLGFVQNITFRPLNLNILNLLNNELTDHTNEEETGLSIENLSFLLKCINYNLENILITKIKRNTFLSKQSSAEAYDAATAEKCALSISKLIPKIIDHMKFITSHLDKILESNEEDNVNILINDKILTYTQCLEYTFNTFTIYFKWIGFKIQHRPLLESSLRSITCPDNDSTASIAVLAVAKYFQGFEKYSTQLTTAVSLIEVIIALQEHTSNSVVTQILRKMSKHFLSYEWKTVSGAGEKGFVLNQSIDNFAKVFVTNIELSEIKNTMLLLDSDIQILKGKNNTLNSYKSITKGNFHILYRNLGNALQESTKRNLTKGLTNLEHLDLWKDVVFILKCMSEIAKTLKIRNILTVFFKKSLPIIRLFLTQGIPILELEFKRRKQEILEMLKVLQHSTRYLQTLCHHFRIKKDKALLSNIPHMKHLLETLVYKVKAVLAANDCSEAFWMGILKNKNIDGEVIATQQSVESEDSVEDEQLLDDDNDDDSDNEELNPDSRSVSDRV